MMLAPDIIASILTGTQPAAMHLQNLTANLWKRPFGAGALRMPIEISKKLLFANS
jgi:hypothetical protein